MCFKKHLLELQFLQLIPKFQGFHFRLIALKRINGLVFAEICEGGIHGINVIDSIPIPRKALNVMVDTPRITAKCAEVKA